MIHLFHGFLGSPHDFSFLPSSPKIMSHDLLTLNLEALAKELTSEDVLIGYSMGGRVALELARKLNGRVKKVVVLAGHPGLTKDEKKLRRDWENEVLKRMESADFMSYWNSLPIFRFDRPIETPPDLGPHQVVFERYRLSEQEDFFPFACEHAEKFLWVVGELDEKYMKLKEQLKHHGIAVKTIKAGHRLLQHPDALKTLLQQEGIL